MNMYKLTHGGSYCWLSLGLSLMLIFLCVVLFPLPVFPPFFFIFALFFFVPPPPYLLVLSPITHKGQKRV